MVYFLLIATRNKFKKVYHSQSGEGTNFLAAYIFLAWYDFKQYILQTNYNKNTAQLTEDYDKERRKITLLIKLDK